MKVLKQLPKLLRFIPGTAQDVRTYMLAMQYWLAGSPENLANLFRMLAGRYGGAKASKLAAPVEYPDVGPLPPADAGLRVRAPWRRCPRFRARPGASASSSCAPTCSAGMRRITTA
jgi:magnesium chelatase subunit H